MSRPLIAIMAPLLLLSAAAGPATADPPAVVDRPDPALAARIEAWAAPFDSAGHLSGTLLVARGGEILFERSWGMANRELGVPNRPGTRFCIASVTKPMTMALMCRLLEARNLGYRDPLSRWIPGFPDGDSITVELLQRHRAGIPHRLTTPGNEAVPRTAADMVELARGAPLDFPPGARSQYSSGGFSVLARVLELAGGAPYGDLLEEWIFAPSGMTCSLHAGARPILTDRASSYLFGKEGLRNAPLKDASFLVGAGSVWSTPRDLLRLMRAVIGGTLGPIVRQALLDETGVDWNGLFNGYRTFADYDTRTGVGVIFVGNVASGALDLLRRAVPRLVAGEPVPVPTPPVATAVDIGEAGLRACEGIYNLRPGTDLDVHVEDGVLQANDWVLIPTDSKTFFSPQDYGWVTVVEGEGGRPEQLNWAVGDTVLVCPRIGEHSARVE